MAKILFVSIPPYKLKKQLHQSWRRNTEDRERLRALDRQYRRARSPEEQRRLIQKLEHAEGRCKLYPVGHGIAIELPDAVLQDMIRLHKAGQLAEALKRAGFDLALFRQLGGDPATGWELWGLFKAGDVPEGLGEVLTVEGKSIKNPALIEFEKTLVNTLARATEGQ